MATKKHQASEMVSIPSELILQNRLQRIKAESMRLRLLIRTAREMERIEEQLTASTTANRQEVTRG